MHIIDEGKEQDHLLNELPKDEPGKARYRTFARCSQTNPGNDLFLFRFHGFASCLFKQFALSPSYG